MASLMKKNSKILKQKIRKSNRWLKGNFYKLSSYNLRQQSQKITDKKKPALDYLSLRTLNGSKIINLVLSDTNKGLDCVCSELQKQRY